MMSVYDIFWYHSGCFCLSVVGQVVAMHAIILFIILLFPSAKIYHNYFETTNIQFGYLDMYIDNPGVDSPFFLRINMN